MFMYQAFPPPGGIVRISACNQLQIAAVITNQSVNSLGLAKGKVAYAVIKASTILIGVD